MMSSTTVNDDKWGWQNRVIHKMSGAIPDTAWLQWPGEVYACWSGRNETSVIVTIAPTASGHALHATLRVAGELVGERFHSGINRCGRPDCQVPGLGKAVSEMLYGCNAAPTIERDMT